MFINQLEENPNEIIDEIIDASFNENLITVKIKPDEDNMFGFNVKVSCVVVFERIILKLSIKIFNQYFFF